MRRIAVVVVVVSLALVAPAAAGSFGALSQQSVDADVVVMTADVAADGDAQWTIAYRVRLVNDSERRAFDDLEADIAANTSTYTDRFHDRMNRTARAGENATGREMAIRNVTVQTAQESVGQQYGVITYRFEWTNFAAVEDGQLRVGDAVSGLFLDSETSLTVRWPAEYRADSISPQPDTQSDTSATWRGQQSFATDEPRVSLAPASGPPTGDVLTVPSWLTGLVALLVVAAAGGGAYLLFRSDLFDDGGETAERADSPAPDDGDDPETPPSDLLSNEEQVLQLLEANGGRLKQQQVAGDLDWTDAKTSQVISGLRDEDEIETFRIGRENVVTLPDTDVTGEREDGTSDGE